MDRGAFAEISLPAIVHNLQSVKKIVKNRPVIAVVKADAYGHGILEVSKRLIREGVYCLAVAYTSEAIELRTAGINIPIIVLFDRRNIKDFFDFRLIPVIHKMDTATSLSHEAKKRSTIINVHVKVDTGMGRLGLKRKIFSHIANSAAALAFQDAHLDAVRPGLMLYGYSPFNHKSDVSPPSHPSPSRGEGKGRGGNSERINLIPEMSIKTKILNIRNVPSGTPISYGRTFITKRPSRIGVLPLGYADGYSRFFSNNADVLVKGRRVPVAGTICMDLTMIDLTVFKDVREYCEVIFLGKQGKESIRAEE